MLINPRTPFRLPATPLLLIGLSFAAAISMAKADVLIDFDSDQGYSSGDLYTQPSTGSPQWTGAANRGLTVTAGKGTDGSSAVLVSNVGATNRLDYLPTTQQMPDFSGTSSIVDFSFDYRYDGTLVGAKSNTLVYFGNTGSGAVGARLAITSNGTISFNSGANASYIALNASGGTYTVTDDSTWTHVSGVLNYATDTYTLFINGVQQKVNGSEVLSFTAASGVYSTTDRISIYSSTATDFVNVAVDNITLAVEPIPEPGTLSLSALAVGALWAADSYRKRKAQ